MTAEHELPPIDELLHARGLRVTSQRRRVLAALHEQAHLTPEQVVAAVAADGRDPLPPSTVYRALDVLEELGVVTHTHLTHGAPTYHLADHDRHLHLVCRTCARVQAVPLTLADAARERLLAEVGFAADLDHMAIHGQCADCRDAPLVDATAAHPLSDEHPSHLRTTR